MKTVKIAALAACLLVAAACGSTGSLGDLAEILGSTGPSTSSDVSGVVRRVDTSAQRIDLDVAYVNNLRDERQGSSIYYDSNTVVEYQGRQYTVADLENGDEISVTGANRDGRYVAARITVTRDVS